MDLLEHDYSSEDSDDSDYKPDESELNEAEDEPCDDDEDACDTGLTSENAKGQGSELPKPSTEEVLDAEEVWKNFLSDVSKQKTSTNQEKDLSCVKSSCSSTDNTGVKSNEIKIAEDRNGTDMLSKIPADTIKSPFKSTDNQILQTDIIPEKNVCTASSVKSSAEPSNSKEVMPSKVPISAKRTADLSSLLGKLQPKKQKVTTLQKSIEDWNSFKKEEGIENELKIYNKGKGGFIERKAFLNRSDVRSYEAEKSVRLSKKNTHL